MSGILEVEGLTKRFGGLAAVDDVSFSVREGGISGLIGPNGAGKTTIFNLITGVYKVTEGDVILPGRAGSRTWSPTRSRTWASPGPSRTSGSSRTSPSSRTS
ncbi:MAG: ATP-binding cassette domain-containing protein [Ignavibacteriales bacterium]|nr:ATP-binding cassette domain-containing protein [Ignavibacteriales bacterium]